MSSPRRVNKGPAAAAENRAALLEAARGAFAAHGLNVPLSLIAREAGVGQGSLYRHFPNREAIILAVFRENIEQLEALAADVDSTLDELLDQIFQQMTTVTPLFDSLAGADLSDSRLTEVIGRLYGLLGEKLADETRRGSIRADATAEEIFLAVGMLGALLNRTPEDQRATIADKSWQLLLRSLRR
ncbi:helix-turn-helix domain-containing protein [Nocardia sp. NPDC005978]|uniref:TetR/AcrR family transcriptional regulator n=1 Tax=unclassified Nocardia TaxID=2637762 RepID=UPI0033AD8666